MSAAFRRGIEVTGSLGGVGLALGVGIYQGVQQGVLTVAVPILAAQVAVGSAAQAMVAFAVLVAASGLLLFAEVVRRRPAERYRYEGPSISALVPVYREPDVLPGCVRSLLDSDYEQIEVAILVEPDDEATRSVAEELAERHSAVRVLVNRNPGSKARAINDAVARLDSPYFCSIDADERAAPDFLPAAMCSLVDDERDVFQARRVPRATGLVETLGYCERLCFHASYKLVEPLGFTYCRSSSCAFQRSAFEAVGGFDDLTTEDLDFAHACFRHGLDVEQARNVTNCMEAPHTLSDLWGQRKRWRLGHVEVFSKAISGGYDAGGLRGTLSTVRVTVTLAASVLLVTLLAKAAVAAYLGHLLVVALPLAAIALALGPVVVLDARDDHVDAAYPAFALVPLIYPGFGLVTISAAVTYVCNWDGEWYRVDTSGV